MQDFIFDAWHFLASQHLLAHLSMKHYCSYSYTRISTYLVDACTVDYIILPRDLRLGRWPSCVRPYLPICVEGDISPLNIGNNFIFDPLEFSKEISRGRDFRARLTPRQLRANKEKFSKFFDSRDLPVKYNEWRYLLYTPTLTFRTFFTALRDADTLFHDGNLNLRFQNR